MRRTTSGSASAIFACVTLFLTMGGCSRPKPLIYVIPRTTANLFWESVHNGALSAGERFGYRIYWNAATREDDVNRQIVLIQQAHDRHPAGLVLAPSHAAALITGVRSLLASGMPIVVIESRLPMPEGPNLHYITTNHERAGLDIAQEIGLLEAAPRVAFIGVDPDISGNMATVNGVLSGLKGLRNAEVTAMRLNRFNRQQSEEQVRSILQSDQDVNVIVALNPAATAGTLDALHHLDRARRPRVIGCDQETTLLEPLARGEIAVLVVQDTYRQGYEAVRALAQHRDKGTWPTEVESRSLLVRKEDLALPEVKRMFTMSPER